MTYSAESQATRVSILSNISRGATADEVAGAAELDGIVVDNGLAADVVTDEGATTDNDIEL